MNEKYFLIEKIGGRLICLRGIGRMFYEKGFPISMSISVLKERDIETSILHIADECLKHGWLPETTVKKLKYEIEDAIIGDDESIKKIDISLLERFCYVSYEDQREMIFQYLFGMPSKEAIDNVDDFLNQNFINKITTEIVALKFKEFLTENNIPFEENVSIEI